MKAGYQSAGSWRSLAVVALAHTVALYVLLKVEPVAQAVGLQQPLMVSLLTQNEPEPPKPLSPKPQVVPVQPSRPPPILTARAETPTPIVAPAPPPELVPVPVVLPTPAAESVKPVAQAAAVATPPPAPVVPPRFDADYLDNPAPAYPVLSRRLGERGLVLLRVYVSSDGAATQVEIRESSGYERLDKAAHDTVQRWRFVPAKQGDKGVAAWVLVPISFSLRS